MRKDRKSLGAVAVRRATEAMLATATVGHGVQPAGLTVKGHVRLQIFSAAQAQQAAAFQLSANPETPTIARSSVVGVPGHDVGKGVGSVYFTDDPEALEASL